VTALRLLIFALCLTAPPSAQDAKPVAAPVTFDAQVEPILAKRCAKCRTAERPRGDLDLSTLEFLC